MEHVIKSGLRMEVTTKKRRGHPLGQPLRVGMTGQISNNLITEFQKITELTDTNCWAY